MDETKTNNIKSKNKGNLKLKSYLLDINNPKIANQKSRNRKWININNININEFQNNNYTYVTIIKKPDTQKINTKLNKKNILNKNRNHILNDLNYQNSLTQNSSLISYKPGFYKPIFTLEFITNSNIKKFNERLIKQNETNNIIKKPLNIQPENIKTKLNININKKTNLMNQRNQKNQPNINGKIQSYSHFYKGVSQTFKNILNKIKISN